MSCRAGEEIRCAAEGGEGATLHRSRFRHSFNYYSELSSCKTRPPPAAAVHHLHTPADTTAAPAVTMYPRVPRAPGDDNHVTPPSAAAARPMTSVIGQRIPDGLYTSVSRRDIMSVEMNNPVWSALLQQMTSTYTSPATGSCSRIYDRALITLQQATFNDRQS